MSDQALLRLTYALLIFYNVIFFLGKYVTSLSFIQPIYRFIDSYLFYFSVLEFAGVAAVFVDLIAKYDSKPILRRRISLVLCALLLMAMLAKWFITWFHSALLVD